MRSKTLTHAQYVASVTPYQRRGDPEGLVLQLLHHLVVNLGGGERIIDSPRFRPDPRLLGS